MANECVPLLNTGLRGFAVATTKISDVNGAYGKLIYRGYPVKDLAGTADFEEVVYLLLYEKLPVKEELSAFKDLLVKERYIPDGIIHALKGTPVDALPMDVLQVGNIDARNL